MWDENDTVLESRWYEQRRVLEGNDLRSIAEYRAAHLAAAHADTPSVLHRDVLGRVFLKLVDNGPNDIYQVHYELDILGRVRTITDARGNIARRYERDMTGTVLSTRSNDCGEQWTLYTVTGRPLRRWDAQGQHIRMVYDALQRPVRRFEQHQHAAEHLIELLHYGETQPNAVGANLRGRLYQIYDSAGLLTYERYDFKGNLLRQSRRFATSYHQATDWSPLVHSPETSKQTLATLLENEVFTVRMRYDALNRPIQILSPDSSRIELGYNARNLLQHLRGQLLGSSDQVVFVKHVAYTARGQRARIDYGNDISTTYSYEAQTARLSRSTTQRGRSILQDVHYIYDPVGNVIEMQDAATDNPLSPALPVPPGIRYTYDALYRLIEARGRELGKQGYETLPTYDYNDYLHLDIPHSQAALQMRTYSEQYHYDQTGNMLSMAHQAQGGSWKRRYEYVGGSNLLQSTSFPGDPGSTTLPPRYVHDANGHITRMPHLSQIDWSAQGAIRVVNLGVGSTAYYIYDAHGQRVRKVVVHSQGTLIEEDLYIGTYEIFRGYSNGSLALERETLHILDGEQRIALVETKAYEQKAEQEAHVEQSAPLIRYQINDAQQSSQLELDEEGEPLTYEEYYPYGGTSYLTAHKNARMSPKRYRYRGWERDEETGLYSCGPHAYAPWLAQWLSAPPLSEDKHPS